MKKFKIMIKIKIILLLLFIVPVLLLKAQDTISVADFGLKPNSGQDARPYLKRAINACKDSHKTILYFPKGRYDFYPEGGVENKTDILKRNATTGISLKNLKNVTFDGGGSDFIFHGKMQIAEIDSCTNVTLRNFSVDWDRPFISQGEIVSITDNYLDLKIDIKSIHTLLKTEKSFLSVKVGSFLY